MSKRQNGGRPSILLLILIVVLILTNPKKDDFYDWAQNQALENSETIIGGAISNIFVSPLLKSVTIRKDYVLFSIYQIDLEGSEMVYIGVFKQFIQIKED